MGSDATVLVDDGAAYDDGTVAAVRVLSVPKSDRFPNGIKYKFHYGEVGAENPIIRFDNHHGIHELHLGSDTYEIEFCGLEETYEIWRGALPPEKRNDWQP